MLTKLLPGVTIADKCPMVLPKDGVRRLAMEDSSLNTDTSMTALAERPALALLLKKMPEKEGDVIGKLVIHFITEYNVVPPQLLMFSKDHISELNKLKYLHTIKKLDIYLQKYVAEFFSAME